MDFSALHRPGRVKLLVEVLPEGEELLADLGFCEHGDPFLEELYLHEQGDHILIGGIDHRLQILSDHLHTWLLPEENLLSVFNQELVPTISAHQLRVTEIKHFLVSFQLTRDNRLDVFLIDVVVALSLGRWLVILEFILLVRLRYNFRLINMNKEEVSPFAVPLVVIPNKSINDLLILSSSVKAS